MKFGHLLEDQQIVEWKKAYMNYRLLKKLIKRIKKQKEQQQPLHRYNSLAHQRLIGPLYELVSSKKTKPTTTADAPSVNTSSATTVHISPTVLDERSALPEATRIPSHHQSSFQEEESNSDISSPVLNDEKPSTSFWQNMKRRIIGQKQMDEKRRADHAKSVSKKEQKEQIETLIQIERNASWPFLTDATYLSLPLENQQFFIGLHKEMKKVNQFYEKEESTFFERHQVLKSQIEELEHGHKHDYNALHMLKEAFKEHYRSLQLLNNFRVLNYTAYKKIIKKYNKVSGHLPVPNDFLEEQVTTHEKFYSSPVLETMIEETENLFILHLYEGDRKKGMDKLRLKGERIKQQPTHVFRFVFLLSTLQNL